jgi:hypothetical protein
LRSLSFDNNGLVKPRCGTVAWGPVCRSSWNLAFCGPKYVLQRLQNIKCFWKKNPSKFRVQISPRAKTMYNAWIFPPNFFIEYFSLQTSAKIIHR